MNEMSVCMQSFTRALVSFTLFKKPLFPSILRKLNINKKNIFHYFTWKNKEWEINLLWHILMNENWKIGSSDKNHASVRWRNKISLCIIITIARKLFPLNENVWQDAHSENFFHLFHEWVTHTHMWKEFSHS